MTDRASVEAFAPASIGNVGVGFDVLGLAVGALGDRVRVDWGDTPQPSFSVGKIEGDDAGEIPTESDQNVCTLAARRLIEIQGAEQRLDRNVVLSIKKGVPLSSGLGGSAASACAAVVAVDSFLNLESSPEALFEAALFGEGRVSGGVHPDNVAPSLFGGLQLCSPESSPLEVPVPKGISAVLLHPQGLRLSTRDGRQALPDTIPMGDFVRQSAALASFVSACHRDDPVLMKASFLDIIAGPVRSLKIPGFSEALRAARSLGVIAFGVSGSGPALFALARGDGKNELKQLLSSLTSVDENWHGWTSKVPSGGARCL